MLTPSFGSMNVDWENRIDISRLREERLKRLTAELERSSLGALLCFDFHNIRYMTSTHIGTWAMDKMIRFALLPRGGAPVLWDFGSAARHHQLYAPWLDAGHRDLAVDDARHIPDGGLSSPSGTGRGARAGLSTLRGALGPRVGRAEDVAAKVFEVLAEHGLVDAPIGVDIVEPPVLFALQSLGLDVVDGQQVCLEARRIKTRDEIGLLTHAASMVDAAYDDLYEFLRPGIRENECVGRVSKTLYDLGSEHVEGVNAISGERCSPHPHVFSDRIIRPGDPAFFDILHSYMGYRTCYYRTFAVGSASTAQRDAYTRCREYMDIALAHVRPGATTADIVELWPRAEEFGFPDEEAAFALQYGHGVGLSIWEKPIFSRLTSFDAPEVLEEGMVFALETYWPARDGWGAARIEEEVVVTADGCEVITKFPAEELLVAGRRYHAVGGPLPTERDSQSHMNTAAPGTRSEHADGVTTTV
ncbi:M24 family metallopeptidase [Streptomyces sp. NPDC050743]|uniref:M24 family metallopeptidase n=1 Tax=Streptomyces sp. NPDC050743 TaxID=3365634 RepID=UPI0037A7E4C6